jgi:hypothetical protein
MRKSGLLSAVLILTALLAACEKPGAWGDVNGIIVVSNPEAWLDLEDTVETALTPRVRAVRDERTFRVTHVDPTGTDWGNLQRFVQMVAIGSVEDPWIQEALLERRDEGGTDAPQLIVAYDVWARGQQVNILLTEPGQPQQAADLLGELQEMLDEQFRSWVQNRMFISGVDTTLQRLLPEEHGFSLTLPAVYDWESRDSVFKFRNDNPDPSELIREVVVSWRSPIPDVEVNGEYILEWRAERVEGYYAFPQVVVTDQALVTPGTMGGKEAFQVQAVWENPPEEFPAAGPFILRAVKCPEQDRLYLLDAWLYAPGKEKYQFMLQLETILNSFKCDMPA